jgi:hypothetical protein
MNVTQVVYVAAGLLLPLYYVPQVLKCWRDDTQLAAYSLGKSGTQLLLRTLMLPFVYGVGDPTMSFIVSLDFAGRAAEYVAAVLALRRQSSSWLHIAQRSLPLKGWRQEPDTPQWQREPAYGHYAMKPGQHEGTERADGRASGSH